MFQQIIHVRGVLSTFWQSPKIQKWLPYLPQMIFFLALVIVYLVLSPVLNYPFNIFGDSFIMRSTTHLFRSEFYSELINFYYGLSGASAKSGRILNLFFHLINGAGVFFLAKQYGKKIGGGEFLPALFAMLFFLFSPLVIENFIWISTLHETLATSGVLFSLLSYAKYLTCRQKRFLVLSFLIQIPLVLVQPASLLTPFLLFFYSLSFEEIKKTDLLLRLVPFLLVPLLFYNFNDDFVLWFTNLKDYQLGVMQDFLVRFFICGFYLLSIFSPGERKFDYNWDLSFVGNRIEDQLNGLFSFILIVGFFLFLWKKKWRIYLFFLVAFLLAIVIDLRFLGMRYEAYPNPANDVLVRSFLGDRYLYLPLALFIAYLLPLTLKIRKFKKIYIVFLLVLTGLLSLSYFKQKEQVSYWQRNSTLIKNNYNLNSLSYLALIRLGNSLERSGELLYSNYFYELAHFRFPDENLPIERLISYYNFYKNYDRAEFLFFGRLRAGKSLAEKSYLDMAEALEIRNDVLQAEKIILLGLKANPSSPQLFKRLIELWNKKKQLQRDAFETLGHHSAFKGDFSSAQKFLMRAYQIDPENPRMKESTLIFQEALKAKQIEDIKKQIEVKSATSTQQLKKNK